MNDKIEIPMLAFDSSTAPEHVTGHQELAAGLEKPEEYCKVVRGQIKGEPWGWDVVSLDGAQLAHFGTKEKAEAWAEGYTIGRLWKPKKGE